jgi:predicted transcriptional regulator
MKSKTLHILFSNLEDLAQEVKQAMRTREPSKHAGKEIRFESYFSFMSFLFPHKFSLLVAIKTESPKSVYQLAQLVDRQQNAVLRDCDELEAFGFIKYESGERNAKIPKLAFDYDTIVVHDQRGYQSHQLPAA